MEHEFLLTTFSMLEILAKAEWWTVDPYMRLRSVANMKIGDQFTGGQVARYIVKKNYKGLT